VIRHRRRALPSSSASRRDVPADLAVSDQYSPSPSLRACAWGCFVSALPPLFQDFRVPVCCPQLSRRLLLCLFLLVFILSAFPPRLSSAQSSGRDDSPTERVRGWLAEGQRLARSLSAHPVTGPAVGALILFWIIWAFRRVLRRGREGLAAPGLRAPSRGEGRRLARRGAYVEAGQVYERLADWEAAAEAYERGRAYGEAGRVWEHQNQPAKAARLYEQAGEFVKAGDLYARMGNYARASSLFQKGGNEFKAAEAAERAGDLGRAAALFAKFEAFERAGELRFQLRQYAEAADLLGRALGRLRGPQGPTESLRATQLKARRCAEAYIRAGQPLRAAAVFRDHGLEVEAAEQFCRAGDWDAGLGILLRHREFDRAIRLCGELGKEAELHIVHGERALAEDREMDAGREFEAGELWWRAGEMYQRVHEFAKAAEMYTRHGDDERAAEMHVAAGNPAQAAKALERLGKRAEAAHCYQQAGAPREAARVLQGSGDFFGAAKMLLDAGAEEEAMALLQQVGPDSEQYLNATIQLGDLFLARDLDGPAREKYERAAAIKPIAPDFVYPTYQLARIYERQGNFQEALRLYEKVVAEQFDYRDVQQRVTDLSERQAGVTQVLPNRESTAAPGQTVPGRYRIIKEVGRGGMGIVYQAEDIVLQRQVAYKVLPDAVREDPKALEAFLREARIAASLHHPNIVTIFDAGQAADTVYIAMEYVDGRSLQSILEEVRVLPLSRAIEVFRQACRSLIHAHRQQVVHRDVKPANIMVTRTGEVKLMDFGLAAVVSSATEKVTSIRGTPFYMAPEQIMGGAVSGLTDQYSLGCTLFHMVTGRPPFVEGDVLYHHIHSSPGSPRRWNSKIPVWLDAIILRMMVKAPARRFPSLDAAQQEVERYLTGSKPAGPPNDVAG
jgi:tetratricopeptide (TPR) repeat protein